MRHMLLGFAALLCAGFLAACGDSGEAKISGAITSATPLALPAGATVEIALLDITQDDPAAVEIAQTSFQAQQTEMPLNYEIAYDPAKIETGRIYTLAVRILSGDEVHFAATSHNATVTGVGTSILDLVVTPVGPLAPGTE